jgi:DNA modification methylase
MLEELTKNNNNTKNKLLTSDEPLHGWYRFVLGYPPHLVREYLEKLGTDPTRDLIFDPFCGTATTPVEARLLGYRTISSDANPIAVLAAKVKLNWEIELAGVESRLEDILELAALCLRKFELSPVPAGDFQPSLFGPRILRDRSKDRYSISQFDPNQILPANAKKLIPKDFISEKPLLRVLALRYAIDKVISQQSQVDFLYLALANTIVKNAGNLAFGPEIYSTKPKEDADVLGIFYTTASSMINDLRNVIDVQKPPFPEAEVYASDARSLSGLGEHELIGGVITSPPYPNEKDYTRSTRLESVLLGLIDSKNDLRSLKSNLIRSNTRNVFVGDDDDRFISDIPSITSIADEIEKKRIDLGKTSGFERLYHRVTRLYFGGMFRHLSSLFPKMRKGAKCAYVVGDQMSYFRVHIRTAHLLADVAMKAGFKVEGIELWRTRRATATGVDLEENVLIMKHPS